MENWSLATMYCISSLPNPVCSPFLSPFFIHLDEQHGVWKCPKTSYPLQTWRRIIHPQPQRPSLASSTRLDHIRLCTCACVMKPRKRNRWRLLRISSQASKASVLTSDQPSHAVFTFFPQHLRKTTARVLQDAQREHWTLMDDRQLG